jgi:anti-sigma regulatory factor (Ser/Thr protein kinase)
MEVMASSHSNTVVQVTDLSQVGEARRVAKGVSERLGFNEEQAGRVAIIATEAASNLAAHGGGGELLISGQSQPGGALAIDVLAVDRGPGMRDAGRNLLDGYSTAGTAGNGLGAIKRLSDEFDLYSQPGAGTVVLARVVSGQRDATSGSLEAAYVCVPKTGERVSGDAVAMRISGGKGSFMIADGLGHGLGASEASSSATKIFLENDGDPSVLLDLLHGALRSTRGAAVAIASIDCEGGALAYAGVGNIAGAIMNGELSRSLVSHNGIVGHQCYRIQQFSYPWLHTGVLVMNSDGLVTNWRLNQYPGLRAKSPAVIAAVLYRDFSRQRDDVSVLVVKERSSV